MNIAAVMINRMVAAPQATTTGTGPNVGTIIATAASDATITALITPLIGQTEQAIVGIPSGYKAYLYRWSCDIDKTQGTAASADFHFRMNPNPDVQELAFINKQHLALQSTGTNTREKSFVTPPCYAGPAIFKVQAEASVNDLEGQSDFDIIIVKDGF